jgi:hypothetical protein
MDSFQVFLIVVAVIILGYFSIVFGGSLAFFSGSDRLASACS